MDEKLEKAREMVCLPLDNLETLEDCEERVKELSDVVGLFKVGKESFTRFGPGVVEMVNGYGSEVFLDLKYHDIPNTVKGAATAAASLGVYMFNVHASGGSDMLCAAVEGANEGAQKYGCLRVPKVIGVTVLTSIDKDILNNELNVLGHVEDQVVDLAHLAKDARLDGIVCSAADLYAVKGHYFPSDFMYVTPGIKAPSGAVGSDQKRVFTPGNAVQDGSSVLVIGRAITGGKTPEERHDRAMDILNDMVIYL